MARRLHKTTLAPSPDAENELTEIKPNEVSIVDMPANGEPYIVVKRGGTVSQEVQKLTTEMVPRPVMKAVEARLDGVKSMVGQIIDVAKSLPVDKDGNNKHAPYALVSLVKATAAELRTLQSPDSVKVQKRGRAESVLSVQELIKRTEGLAFVSKANAVSYLMRDQYVEVTQSVMEWLTTYVDGIEHDDDGPTLIPSDLNEGIESSAGELEKLAEDYPASDDDDFEEPDAQAEVNKLLGEVKTLKETLKAAQEEGKIGKKGSKMAAERLKSLKSVSSGVSEAAEELSNIIKELEDDPEEEEGGDMATDNTDKTPEETTKNAPQADPVPAVDQAPETGGVQKNATGELVTNEQLMAALTKFNTDTNARLDKIESDVVKANETATAAQEGVEKIHLARCESRGGDSDYTTKNVNKNVDDPADFSGLLGIPKG